MTTHTPTGQPASSAGAWLKLSAGMSAQVPPIAGRDDIVVTCAPGAGQGHPACFWHERAHIEVDGSLLGVNPAAVDPARPSDRERYPVAWGALTHECAHAAHTRWRIPAGANTAWAAAAKMLEESRIEHQQITRRPGDRPWLRASAADLILKDFTAAGAAPATNTEAGNAAALLLARADAGILDQTEITDTERAVAHQIGAARLAQLRDVWRQAHATADTDARTMLKLGRRWCRILGTDPDTPPEKGTAGSGDSASDPTGSGSSSSPVARELRQAAARVIAASSAEFAPVPIAPPGRAGQRGAELTAQNRAAQAASRVFASGPAGCVTGTTRDPDEAEKAAARKLTRALRAATAGERAATTVASITPPGRLSMRQALAGNAQRAAGAVPTARPFTRTTRRRVPAPPMRVGIACDVSGSMRRFTGPVASAAWILARASSAIPAATTATVTYSWQVQSVTCPGRAPARVAEFDACGSGHLLGEAIDSLDGALGLSRPGSARLLVIVSDGIYTTDEVSAARQRISRLTTSGCGVLWLGPDSTTRWPATCTHVTALADPAATIDVIAHAATRALTT